MKRWDLAALAMAALLAGCSSGGGGSSVSPTPLPAQIHAVWNNGAKGDGVTNDTAAIQRTLDAASKDHGTVVFAPGVYMTGALFINSDTTVQIDEGVTLMAIQAPTFWDIYTPYPGIGIDSNPVGEQLYPQVFTRVQGDEMNWVSAILNVRNAQNVTITGKGVIDGQGQTWWDHYYGYGTTSHSALGVTWALNYDEERPRALEVFQSKNITLKDITLQNSPFWTVHLCYSDQIHVDGVTVHNLMNASGHMPSTDGIDLDSATNVLVENCDITANDDAFVIKSGRDADGLRVNLPTANVVFRNSVVQAGAAGFTIGSETSGGANNIEVYNIHVKPMVAQYSSNIGYSKGGPTVPCGFIFKSSPSRGGIMENIYIHDITIDDANYFMQTSESWTSGGTWPATFGTTYSKPPYWDSVVAQPNPPDLGYPIFRNIRFANITMAHVENSVFNVVGYTIAGELQKGQFSNFTFDNVQITAVNKAGTNKSGGSIANSNNWTFTNSSIVNATGGAVTPSKNATTTSAMTGLAGW